MECSDDLFKIDSAVETITFKMLNTLEEIAGTSDLAVVTKPSTGGACLFDHSHVKILETAFHLHFSHLQFEICSYICSVFFSRGTR